MTRARHFVVSNHARAEAVTSRCRMVQDALDNPLRPLRPLWHECLSCAVLVAVLALLAWWH